MRLIDKVHDQGLEQLDDRDLLAILLTTGRDQARCRQIADLLLDDFGGLTGVWKLAHDGIPSLGEARSMRLAAAFEVGIRCLERRNRRELIRCSADIVAMLGPRLARCMHEQVWLLALDSRNGVIARRRVAEGGIHGCAVLASDVLRVAIAVGASSFVLVHNHPGGDATPSKQDLRLTERLSEAAACVGVPLVDHVIIAGDEHRSLLDLGVIEVPLSEQTPAVACPVSHAVE
ncbi:MAG: DNA repair protein [Deltaproteobacteria bacterium]|nr:DNA repair protein [Deltaproteobacteria bacterium]